MRKVFLAITIALISFPAFADVVSFQNTSAYIAIFTDSLKNAVEIQPGDTFDYDPSICPCTISYAVGGG